MCKKSANVAFREIGVLFRNFIDFGQKLVNLSTSSILMYIFKTYENGGNRMTPAISLSTNRWPISKNATGKTRKGKSPLISKRKSKKE